MSNPIWSGVEIDYELLKEYGWYTGQVTVGGQAYPRWVGYGVAGLLEMDSRVAAAGASKDAAALSSADALALKNTTQEYLTSVQGLASQVTADKATVQGLKDSTQTLRDSAAASALLAQGWVGTATNVVVPGLNYRLASAWDAGTGAPTAYGLTNVVATYVYDTRKDWDFGRWRKGKLARQSSWYNETLNTATRGAKKEFPAVALIVVVTGQTIIYDLNDLDSNASPRMWMVIKNAGSTGADSNLLGASGNQYSGVYSVGGKLLVSSTNIGLIVINFLGDNAYVVRGSGAIRGMYRGNLSQRNSGAGFAGVEVTNGGIPSDNVYSVHARVLPGAPLDPVSRLPIPTIAVATSVGTSVIHPTGLVANVTTVGGHARCALTNSELWMYRRTADDGRGVLYRMPVPYASGLTPTVSYLPGTTPGLLTATAAHIPAFARWIGGWARGGDTGLTIAADDQANPSNSMYANVTNTSATGWMPGDTRLAAITEGAGSNGASGGELVANGSNITTTAGYTARNGASLSAVGGALRVTSTGTSGQGATYTVTTTAGTQYTVSFDVVNGGNPTAYYYVDVTEATETTMLAPAAGANANGVSGIRINFVATSTQTKVRLFTTSTSGQYVDYTNISCRKTGTFSDTVTGSGELIVNGDGSTTAGWQAYNGGTISTVGGRLRATYGTAIDFGYQQAFPTVVGETYLIALTVNKQTAPGVLAFVDTANGGTYVDTTTAGDQFVRFQFKATSTSTKFILRSSGGGQAAGQYVEAFGISCKLAIPDRSYKGKGLIVNGTLTRTPVAAGSDLYVVSGFGANAYLEQPYNSDTDFGAGDFFVCGWVGQSGNSPTQLIFQRGTFSGAGDPTGASITLATNTNSQMYFRISDGVTTAVTQSTVATNQAGLDFVCCIRRAGAIELWVNDRLAATSAASSVGSVSNTTAGLIVGGGYYAGKVGFGSGRVAMFRTGAYAPTPTRIRKMYADEAPLFQASAKAFLGGTSNNVQSLALDEDTGVLHVGTADGADQFAGLRRVGRIAANTQGIGAELVSNPGGPFTATTGWSTNAAASLAVSGGELMLTADTSGRSGATTITTVANKRYTITAVLRCGTATRVTPSVLGIGDGTAVTATTATTVQFSFVATGTSHNFNFYVSSAGTAYLSSVSIKEVGAASTNNVTSVAAGGGTVLVGTANEAGVVSDLMPIKDELRQVPAANSNDIVFDYTTLDAVQTAIGRVFVNEGESVLVDALVEATEYGQTPVEGASFRLTARVRRNLNGNVAIVGNVLWSSVDKTTSTIDATITVDTTSQTFAVSVIGKAGTRLIWRASLRSVWIGDTRTAA